MQTDAELKVASEVTPVTPVVTVTEPVMDEKAVSERLKQQNARQAKLLASLGIDPLSDLGEQLESGLITEEMVKQHVLSRTQPVFTQNVQNVLTDPVDIAYAELEKAKVAYEKETLTGGISINTNNAYLNAMQRLNDARLDNLTRQIAAREQSQQVNENVERVLSVVRSVPEYGQMDDNLKRSFDTVNIATTGIIADREAKKMGLDPSRLNAQQYEYFAKKATEELGTLAEYYMEVGRRQVKNNLLPNTNRNIPVPASSGGGQPVPANNPYANVGISNHTDAARKFMQGVGRM
jgi:hypothetical protein